MSPARIKIAVAPPAEYEAHRFLFDMLSLGLAVSFEPYVSGGDTNFSALIALSEDEALTRRALERGLSCYQVLSSGSRTVSEPAAIRFTSSGSVHRAFRDAELMDASLKTFCPVPESSKTLAALGSTPVWSAEERGENEIHRVGVALPPFTANDFFHIHFRATRWFAMVPLLHFLRHLLGPECWKAPEPRATFIIDDPNLHHRSYGYIDFEALAKHAAAQNYHATVATVPLDAWYFNRDVAAFFRQHRQQISVMMHGVNHIADELARPYTEDDALALLAVGLRRIAAFEARSGVKVDRVMAAPHGAFSESMAVPMLRLGFEGACVSIGSLLRWNSGESWKANLGIPIAQALGSQGFPVFHRTNMSEIDVRLSSFLGHPVIVATHHHDYVSNFARIESLAKIVNDISSPRWMTIEEISRTNYLASVEGGVLRVTPYARRLSIPLPQEASAFQLLPSPFCPEITIDLRGRSLADTTFDTGGPLQCRVSNNVMQIHFPPSDPVDFREVDPMPLGLWPVARRLLAEGRDRAKAMLSFVASAR